MTDLLDDMWADGDLEFKAVSGQLNVDEAQGIVECFVAAVGNKDSVGDVVAPGAFNGSLRRRKPRVVWGHDWNQPIGKVLAIEEVGSNDPRLPGKMKTAGVGGLLARVQFNLRSERGREAFNSVAFFGEDQEWSIGYKTIKATYDPDRQANVLQEVELFEVSPVLHGANQLTGTISIKAADKDDRVDSFDKSKWPMFDRSFAERIKTRYPKIWDAGGNIKGDDQYEILTKIATQGGKARTEDQIKALELREAWIARHKGDFRLPGVIAQIKWLAIGSRGEDHMKKVVNDAVSKLDTKGLNFDEVEAPIARRVRLTFTRKGHCALQDGDNVHEFDPAMISSGDSSTLPNSPPGLGAAVSAAVGSPIVLRVVAPNFVVFDQNDTDETTQFLPFHFDGSRYMFGEPLGVELEPTLTFEAASKSAYDPAASWYEVKAPSPTEIPLNPANAIPDTLPQERVTGDILRGYGPRRGNLEKLLRYWRPIMRREGGFRRCRVILADHPELYPLEPLCAWLHHETTGLWPNEGCHHPGMKNCRRKLKKVVRGSLFSDAEFNDRLNRIASGKLSPKAPGGKLPKVPSKSLKGMVPDGMHPEEWAAEQMDDEELDKSVVWALKGFMAEEPDWVNHLRQADNWEHVGDDDAGYIVVHVMRSGGGEHEEHEGGCGCGGACGGAGGCGGAQYGHGGGCGCGGACGMKDLLADLDIEVKVGRPLSARNVQRIRSAIEALSDLLEETGNGMEQKQPTYPRQSSSNFIKALPEDLFALRSHLDPVLTHHGVDVEVVADGIIVKDADALSIEALDAIETSVKNF